MCIVESVDIWQQKRISYFPRGGEERGKSSFLALTESITTSNSSSTVFGHLFSSLLNLILSVNCCEA